VIKLDYNGPRVVVVFAIGTSAVTALLCGALGDVGAALVLGNHVNSQVDMRHGPRRVEVAIRTLKSAIRV
jgi:hypothetical protein